MAGPSALANRGSGSTDESTEFVEISTEFVEMRTELVEMRTESIIASSRWGARGTELVERWTR